jgi:hypothetical protein
MLFHFLENGVRCVRLRDKRKCFGPRQRRPFPVVEERSLVPSVQRIKALLGFTAARASIECISRQ